MPTSGTTTYELDARELITQALREIRVVASGQEPNANDARDAEVTLNLMLKTWTTHTHLWIVTAGNFPLVAGQMEYSVPNARRMISVRRRYTPGLTDTPMDLISRQEYDDLPNKFNLGTPVSAYFDAQRTARTLSLWPPASAAVALSSTIRYTYYRVIEDIDSLNNTADLPQEWLECIKVNLADRLMPQHNVSYPEVTARAGALMQVLSGQDQEEVSVYLQPDYRGRW